MCTNMCLPQTRAFDHQTSYVDFEREGGGRTDDTHMDWSPQSTLWTDETKEQRGVEVRRMARLECTGDRFELQRDTR